MAHPASDDDETPTAVGSAKKRHMGPDEYKLIVDWLEVKENFEAINGVQKKTSIGQKGNRFQACSKMADHLFNHSKTCFPRLSGKQMSGRFQTYLKLFKTTLHDSKQTGMLLALKSD